MRNMLILLAGLLCLSALSARADAGPPPPHEAFAERRMSEDAVSTTCDPTDDFSFSSVTTSGATVSWNAVSGAVSYYVHWQPVAGGTEQSTQVSGTSYNITGLDACTEYRVRIRTRCGPTDFSAFTAYETFQTASTNPSVSITAESADRGCGVILNATSGFVSYVWSDSDTTLFLGDTSSIGTSKVDTFWVVATDEYGCSDDAFYIVTAFPSNCLTRAQDVELRDSLLADSALHAADVRMLAQGMAGLSNNATVKSLVKTIALEYAEEHYQLYVPFETLIDSCTAHSIDLIAELKEIVWDNREFGTTPDTARIRQILPWFEADNTLETKVYPIMSFVYLDENFQDPEYPNWDSLSVDYVAASAFHPQDDVPLYYLESGSVEATSQAVIDWRKSIPVWQVAFEQFEHPNDFETGPRIAPDGIKRGCRCENHNKTGTRTCSDDQGGGCGSDCTWATCTGGQVFRSWVDHTLFG